MSITSTRVFNRDAFERTAFWQNQNQSIPALNIEGLVQLADSGGSVIDPSTSTLTGGGTSTYSNAQGDFTATVTAGTTNITIAGLVFTLEVKHLVNGSVKKIDSNGLVSTVDISYISVSGSVITLAAADNFASGDSVVVNLTGPPKGYDQALDANLGFVVNPNYEHYTSAEHLIDESDLGIDGTHDGTAAQQTVFTDTGETFTAASVAEGFNIYNVTDGTNAIINADTLQGLAGDGGAGNPTADDITSASLGSDWDTDVASIPECKRFIVPAEGFNMIKFQWLLDSQDAHNNCYLKFYETLNDAADDTDDIYWIDITADYLSGHDDYDGTYLAILADGIGGAARAVSTGTLTINNPNTVLKYMVKIVAECDDGNQNNEFDVWVKKSS